MSAIDWLEVSQRVLDEKLEALSDDQIALPSLLPGWTVGHVLAHIALNADAFVGVADALVRGEVGVMYPGGDQQRDGDIEREALWSANDLRAHISTSARSMADAWRALSADQLTGTFCRTQGAPQFPASVVVERRVREVEVHHHDAGLPWFSFRDWSDDYVDWDLSQQMPGIRNRVDATFRCVDERGNFYATGDVSDLTEPVVVDRRTLLAWALNRADIAGLPEPYSWIAPLPSQR
jgi:maleylpyruvate isomerase